MSPKRELDPEARRLIERLAALEVASWPTVLADYGDTLLALAIRCEEKAGKAELTRWFDREAGGALLVPGQQHRELLRDAFHDTMARSAGLLQQFRVALSPGKRPNLRSMLVRCIHWRANDLHMSLHRRHAPYRDARPLQAGPAMAMAAPQRPDRDVAAREVVRLLDASDPKQRALLLVCAGHTVAEAARRTGCSRQQIYRARELFVAACDREGPA